MDSFPLRDACVTQLHVTRRLADRGIGQLHFDSINSTQRGVRSHGGQKHSGGSGREG